MWRPCRFLDKNEKVVSATCITDIGDDTAEDETAEMNAGAIIQESQPVQESVTEGEG